MGAIYVFQGLANALADLIVGQLALAQVHLFTNNHTPSQADTIADYTELVGTGYVEQAVNPWGSEVLGGDNFYTTTGPLLTFTNSGGTPWLPIYGWYLTDSSGAILLTAGLFAGPITIGVGGNLPFQPILACGSEY